MDEQIKDVENGYFVLNEQYRIVNANEVFLNIVGSDYDIKGLVGCQFDTFLTPSSSLFYHLYFHTFILMNGKVENLNLVIKSVDGNNSIPIPIRLHAEQRVQDGKMLYDCFIVIE
ncbi:hypothetical protein [Paenibacillus sp. L3-i20]|uniref:hypothetical protein n=1 Tax=Paenibacillus sp. L3-i20 TaxID=2905833 RepID=UPI001EDE9724|nr:hypothetical protein [Paenibacillus sp. L3-i20]GKU77780.1 hypothetical protein L3i20_v221770 [Paenibacillus sp. L3-i20]